MAARRLVPILLVAGLFGVLALLSPRRSRATVPPVGQLSLITEPQAGVTPFLTLISGARRTIELTMYELEDRQVESALAAAAKRGVDVRVLLNGGYYSEPETQNRAALGYLAAHRVHVRTSSTRFALTHQKTLTVDGRLSAIMTLNFDGLYASTRDYAILDAQPADVAAITSVFDADWTGRLITPSDGTGDLLWSPGAQSRLLELIDSARNSIELENEEMADPAAVDALCAAARRGVHVHIVMTYESDWRSAFDRLSGCGAQIRLFHGQSYYIHAKLLDIDGTRALVGSQNLSATSLQANRELSIDVRIPALVRALGTDFAVDDARAQAWSG